VRAGANIGHYAVEIQEADPSSDMPTPKSLKHTCSGYGNYSV
jgi:hypothetical protein